MTDPFSEMIKIITKPTPEMEWLSSDHVTKILKEWREEEEIVMTHTPGPWEVGSFSSVNAISDTNVKFRIADATNEYIGIDQSDANARLIAAAPELLEALEEIVSKENHWDGNLTKAIKAIAKAKGREQ